MDDNYAGRMKKFLPVLSLFLVSLSPLFPEPGDLFDKAVDFSLDLKGISALVKNPAFTPSRVSRAGVFDGSIASITVLEPEPGNFLAELEVIGGEWKSLESVSLYRVYVYVQGPEFAARLPRRAPAEGSKDIIGLNNHALVVGGIADVYTDEKGDRFAVILARHIRIIP